MCLPIHPGISISAIKMGTGNKSVIIQSKVQIPIVIKIAIIQSNGLKPIVAKIAIVIEASRTRNWTGSTITGTGVIPIIVILTITGQAVVCGGPIEGPEDKQIPHFFDIKKDI